MKKFVSVLLLCIFTLPVFAKNSILIVGDSLSAAHGIDPAQGWVSLLKKRLHEKGYDYAVINSSISGDTTSQGLARLPTLLQQIKPHVTIIELGGNDGLRGLPLSTIEKNLQQMIGMIKNANSQALLIAVRLPPNYGAEYTDQFHEIYVKMQSQDKIVLVPFFLKDIDEKANLMQADKIHPNVEAQKIMLNNVWPELEGLLIK